uniref:CULT domain-containing protein n=1 Tax=Graphocephala atropunctata TaxID=36148 RepID=A0A1B6L7Y3_9HEMI
MCFRVYNWNLQFSVLLCLIVITTKFSEEKIPTDYILCRQCGTDVASAESLANLRSPAAVTRRNDSLFGLDEVFVQTLINPLHIKFNVVTVLESTCVTSAKFWVSDHSWFPGYAWKPCTCSRCRQQLGWAFEPLELADTQKVRASNKGFYTLILDNIISEFFSDKLLVVPQTVTVR